MPDVFYLPVVKYQMFFICQLFSQCGVYLRLARYFFWHSWQNYFTTIWY